MSSRQLRKLQQQRELEQAQAKLQAEAEEEESEEEPIAPVKTKASLFANLAALENEAEDQEDGEKEPFEDELSEPEPTPTPTSKPKKSKKKKKAKKSKEKTFEKEKSGNSADEIDTALRELNIKQAANPSSTPQPILDPEYERVCKLLGINSQHLKVANEMKNLFGRTAVDNHDDAGGPVGRGARRRQQRAQNQQVDLETALKKRGNDKGLPELTLRRNNFIQGKEDWPNGTTGGLTMALGEGSTKDGTLEFKYVHDKTYQDLQQVFYNLVEMGDPQNLIGLLVRNPYHISLLIQVSKIAKDQGDHALSADLLERALFNLGRAASSAFNTKLNQGKARLDFSRPENRELWLAGYHYIKVLVMKGTYRTALEWAKLLLSINPVRDSYCMRLMIHHLALRAHEFRWLLDLYEDKWAKEGKEDQSPAIYHITPSLAFAALQLRDWPKCRELLADSMNKVPWLFFRLFKDLDLDAPPSIWGVEPRTDAETLFTEICILQTKDLWNTPEATSLLMEVAHTIPKVDLAKIPRVENDEMTLDVVRFVYLDNTPALMALAPSHLLHRSNNSDSDPLPPDHNMISYDAQRLALHDGPRGMRDDYNDPLAAMGRLFPQFRNILGRPHGEDDEGFDDRVAAQVQGLQDMLDEREVDGEMPPPPGLLSRLLTTLFGGGRGDEGDEEWESESDEESVESDEEMPALVDNEGQVVEDEDHEESDEEMPPLA